MEPNTKSLKHSNFDFTNFFVDFRPLVFGGFFFPPLWRLVALFRMLLLFVDLFLICYYLWQRVICVVVDSQILVKSYLFKRLHVSA